MHPFVKILSFIMILIGMSHMSQVYLGALCVISCTIAFVFARKSFSQVVLRMRWLFLSILIVYAFATPGEYIQPFLFDTAPTYEGVQSGLLQVGKLLIAIASLSILFATCSQMQLMTGLYYLLLPLQWLGLNLERFTARLLLTLDYVETLALDKNFKFNFQQFDSLHAVEKPLMPEINTLKQIELAFLPFKLRDKFALLAIALCFLWMVLLSVKAASI